MLVLETIASFGETVAISWNDGSEQYIELRLLRAVCPCVLCVEKADLISSLTDQACRISSYELIGGYAIRFIWEDGHSTGIYSYQFLKNHPKIQS